MQIQPINNAELFNTSFVSLALLLSLLLSLVLTFHSKGTTVHKVLGLLLVSIFVVFLWILQTQFLFIYIVYIMAFISAVLMLFLSVVLMLPISTLTSKNATNNSKVTSILFLSMFSTGSELSVLPAELTLFSMFFVFYLIYWLRVQSWSLGTVLFNQFLEEYDEIIPDGKFHWTYWVGNLHIRYTHRFETKPHYIFNKFMAEFFKALLIISFILEKKFIEDVYLPIRETLFIVGQLGVKAINLQINVLKVVTDIVLQTYLFISIFLSLAVSFFSKQLHPTFKATELNSEIVQGIGQLKTLLYGEFSLFLIFSTIVLLIALLGAAVMTRSKR